MRLSDYRKKLRERNPEAVRKVDRDIAFKTAWLITEIRLKYGLTQQELADKTGVLQPSIARAEIHGASIGLLQKIADKLDIVIDIRIATQSNERTAPNLPENNK